MEKDFSKNVVKPGDKGFEYDKRVDFAAQRSGNQAADESWDEDADEFDGNEDDYFDDDFA